MENRDATTDLGSRSTQRTNYKLGGRIRPCRKQVGVVILKTKKINGYLSICYKCMKNKRFIII